VNTSTDLHILKGHDVLRKLECKENKEPEVNDYEDEDGMDERLYRQKISKSALHCNRSAMQFTDNEFDSFSFCCTEAMCQSLNDIGIFSKLLSVLGFPINKGSVEPRKVSLSKDVVGEMSNLLQLDTLVQADSLYGDSGSRGMDIAICEP